MKIVITINDKNAHYPLEKAVANLENATVICDGLPFVCDYGDGHWFGSWRHGNIDLSDLIGDNGLPF